MNKILLYDQFKAASLSGLKKISVLIDPDKVGVKQLEKIVNISINSGIDYFFIGSSILINENLDYIVKTIKESCDIPLILFPGSTYQVNKEADAILFLSLISGRNPELLIGNHVITAHLLQQSRLEIISTGYMLIDGGIMSSVQYMSNTVPIPHTKNDIAVSTALAGEMLGLKQIYLEAGSGAKFPVSESMISMVKNSINIPLIVGGGISTPERAAKSALAGADMIVIGNIVEKDPMIVKDISHAVHSQSNVEKTVLGS